MTNVYIAATYNRKKEMLGYAEQLPEGYFSTARWIDQEEQETAVVESDARRPYAEKDLHDVAYSDVFVVFTDQPSSTGGYWFEMGCAWQWSKDVIVVGPRVNIFCCLPGIRQFDTWEDCRKELERANP